MKWEFRSNHPDDTRRLGHAIGELACGGEIICLVGDLGAGKTLLTQGIAEGLSVQGYVNSPTFTIVCEYEGRLPLYHMDLYRLDDPQMLEDIGFEEYLSEDGVTVIEWAEKAGSWMPKECLLIRIERIEGPDSNRRYFGMTGIGQKHIRMLKGMMAHADTGNGYSNPHSKHWPD